MREGYNGLTDLELVKLFQQGDIEAFSSLHQRYHGMIYARCHNIVYRNTQDAEDCTQQTFVKVYRALHKFKFEAKFSTWIQRIALNTCINYINTKDYRKRGKTVSGNAPVKDGPQTIIDFVPGKGKSTRDNIDKKITYQAALACMDKLPQKKRTAMMLVDIEGLSYKEAAGIMKVKMESLKSLIHRARTAVKNCIKDRLGL